METAIKYKVIKSRKQYDEYANTLETLVFTNKKSTATQEEIDLLTLLVNDYHTRYTAKKKISPLKLIQSFMKDHHLKPSKMADILEVSKGYVSDIMNGKKPVTIEIAIKLGKYFKVEPTHFMIQTMNLRLPPKNLNRIHETLIFVSP